MEKIQEKNEGSNMIITKPEISEEPVKGKNDENYGRTPELYPPALLNKRMRSIFITLPKSYQDTSALFNALKKSSKSITYVLVAQEKHKDNTPHIHIQYEVNNSIKVETIHKKIIQVEGNIGGSINYQSIKNSDATNNYIKKDGNYLEFGKRKKQHNRTTYDKEGENMCIKTILEDGEMSIEEKLDYVKQTQPLMYMDKRDKLKIMLEEEEVVEKWELPDMSKENITLRPYQQQLWDMISNPPKARQIIWVYGKPGQGKSFMYNYLEENYKKKVYCAGQSASLDNVVYGYNEEGAIIWDIPKSYNWENEELVNTLASTIEKFSDFGTTITSKKYQGKKCRVRGHAIVFSNHKPIKQLKHRDIITIVAGGIEEDNRYRIKEKNGVYYLYDIEQQITKSFFNKEHLEEYIEVEYE